MTDMFGRMVNGFAAQYDFTISDVISESWKKIKGVKAAIWVGIGIYLVATLAIRFLAEIFIGPLPSANLLHSGVVTPGADGSLLAAGVDHFSGLFLLPLFLGMTMIAVKRVVNAPVKIAMVFSYYNKCLGIIAIYFLRVFNPMIPIFIGGALIAFGASSSMVVISAISILLAVLFIAYGIYLALAYSFAPLLYIEKRMPLMQSLKASRKAVTQHWFKIFFAYLLFLLIYIISAIPIFIGLIWTLPMAFTFKGVLYRIMFGTEADIASNG